MATAQSTERSSSKKPCRACVDFKTWAKMQGKKTETGELFIYIQVKINTIMTCINFQVLIQFFYFIQLSTVFFSQTNSNSNSKKVRVSS